ncbi:hypothetical protein Pelo_8492 [Pelomyxa schiedti]|nr:hypothetical protein Pelo_8492 [Pelomyxa schiedti]
MLKSIQPPLRVKFTTLNGLFNTGPTIVDYVSPFQARVTLSGGIQQWVVPVAGNYKLTAIGASGGGGWKGGLGAIVVTTLNLQQGQTINILVGQTGGDGSPGGGGGGGGTFVWENGVMVQGGSAPTTNGKILVCAGGGGGATGFRWGGFALCNTHGSGEGGKGGGGCGAGWLYGGGPSEKGAGPGLTPMHGGTGGASHPSDRGGGGFGGGGGGGCWDQRSGEGSSTGGGDGGTSFIFKKIQGRWLTRQASIRGEGSVVFQLRPPKTLEPLFG